MAGAAGAVPGRVSPVAGDSQPQPPPVPEDLVDIIDLLDGLDDEAVLALVEGLPQGSVEALLGITASASSAILPDSPLAQARELDEGYRERAHLVYLATRLARAVEDVEAGITRRLVISMPPRSGKSLLTSVYLATWLLRLHSDWKIGLISHSPSLAVGWGRQVRRIVETHGSVLGLQIASDAGAASEWQTTDNGGIVSRSAPGQSITGLGFKVMLLDDIVKDFASAHSALQREAVWDWWLANAQTRLEPPALVVVVGTRWHEDDFIGRLLSPEYEGDPDEWEVISFPALAEAHDVLGREPGQPLLSPLLDETEEEAVGRWEEVRRSVGSYAWSALYQQRPAAAKGAIFDVGWWRYWTSTPEKATEDGRVVYLDPATLSGARWVDSWDMAFKAKDDSDYVVGQRWVQVGANRYLIAQSRARRTFTQTLTEMRRWGDPLLIGPDVPPCSRYVHERLVEDKANGTAILDTLKEEIPGLIPIDPTTSKQARARSITPEVEAGNVLLPLPSDPGNEWVTDLLAELRDFPTGAHDDQVDALTQALSRMRKAGTGSVVSPNRVTSLPNISRGRAAMTTPRRARG